MLIYQLNCSIPHLNMTWAVARWGNRGVRGLVQGTRPASADLTTSSAIDRTITFPHRRGQTGPTPQAPPFPIGGGRPPTAGTFNALIDACTQAVGPSKAFEVLAEMEAAGVAPTAGTFNARILVCLHTKDLDKAFEVLAEMKAAGIRPAASTVDALLEACNNAGDVGKAVEVAAEMEAAGFSRDAATNVER